MQHALPKGWKELLTWTFKGPRFEDNGVDLSDLAALHDLRDLLIENAKELWKRENPSRVRLPRGFEERIQLKVFELLPGSAVVPVCYKEDDLAPPLLPLDELQDPRDVISKLPRAAAIVVSAIRAAEHGDPLPSELPRHLLPSFEALARTLRVEDTVGLRLPGDLVDAPSAHLTAAVRQRFSAEAQKPWEDDVDVAGEVTMASLRGQATIMTPGGTIEIRFSPDQEKLVTGALHDHERVRLRVVGRGTYEPPRGRLKRIERVDGMEELPGLPECMENVRPIWEVAAEIAAAVSDDIWEGLPRDGAANHDLYVYGSSKSDDER